MTKVTLFLRVLSVEYGVCIKQGQVFGLTYSTRALPRSESSVRSVVIRTASTSTSYMCSFGILCGHHQYGTSHHGMLPRDDASHKRVGQKN